MCFLPAARKQKLTKEGDPSLQGEHIREGLGGIVSVKVRSMGAGWNFVGGPEFGGEQRL